MGKGRVDGRSVKQAGPGPPPQLSAGVSLHRWYHPLPSLARPEHSGVQAWRCFCWNSLLSNSPPSFTTSGLKEQDLSICCGLGFGTKHGNRVNSGDPDNSHGFCVCKMGE